MKELNPTIYTDFEGDSLIGNRKGFENLRDRISSLLEGHEEQILLYPSNDDDFEEFFTWLSLDEKPETPVSDSSGLFFVYVFISVLFLGVIFAIIGIVQSLSWFFMS